MYNSINSSSPAKERAVEDIEPGYALGHNPAEIPAQRTSPAHGHKPPCGGFFARLRIAVALQIIQAEYDRRTLLVTAGIVPSLLSDLTPQERRQADLAPTKAERRAELLRRYDRSPNENVQDPTIACYRALDGTRARPYSDALGGLRQVAAAEVMGITRTHAKVALGTGLIVVTLVQPPKRDADTIRSQVMQFILSHVTQEDFQSRCQQKRARRQEIALAERVMALWHVGDRTDEDRELRRKVGFQIVEIRSR